MANLVGWLCLGVCALLVVAYVGLHINGRKQRKALHAAQVALTGLQQRITAQDTQIALLCRSVAAGAPPVVPPAAARPSARAVAPALDTTGDRPARLPLPPRLPTVRPPPLRAPDAEEPDSGRTTDDNATRVMERPADLLLRRAEGVVFNIGELDPKRDDDGPVSPPRVVGRVFTTPPPPARLTPTSPSADVAAKIAARHDVLIAETERAGHRAKHCGSLNCTIGATMADPCMCACTACIMCAELLGQAQEEVTGKAPEADPRLWRVMARNYASQSERDAAIARARAALVPTKR